LGFLDHAGRGFQIRTYGGSTTDLERNERIDDLSRHGLHESPTSLGFSLEVISNFRPSGSQHGGLKASIKELIHVEGLAVKFDE
jgi:hypothetical protein